MRRNKVEQRRSERTELSAETSRAKNGEPRRPTNALVGGVLGLEVRRDRSDEEKGADERRSCSRGAAGAMKLSDML